MSGRSESPRFSVRGRSLSPPILNPVRPHFKPCAAHIYQFHIWVRPATHPRESTGFASRIDIMDDIFRTELWCGFLYFKWIIWKCKNNGEVYVKMKSFNKFHYVSCFSQDGHCHLFVVKSWLALAILEANCHCIYFATAAYTCKNVHI